MNSTVIVAALGFASTVLAAWLTAHSQRQGDREGRILDARVRIYGECSNSLYEYARATYNRAKVKLESPSREDQEELRQEAYRCNARARSAIGQVAIFSGNEGLEENLAKTRHTIGQMNDVGDRDALKQRQEQVYQMVKEALKIARSDLMMVPTARAKTSEPVR